MSQQSAISSFFKRKEVDPQDAPSHVTSQTNGSPLKKIRRQSPPRSKTPPQTPLSDRTRQWHIDDPTEIVLHSPEKDARRKRFAQKLDQIEQRRQSRKEGDGEDDQTEAAIDDVDEQDEQDEEQEEPSELAQRFLLDPTKTPNFRHTVKEKGVTETDAKLTPLEKQYVKLQEENPSTLLLIEVGYKYRILGPNARIASQILGIAYFKSHAFLNASIPVHRLYIHVNRLVKAGHKVGVVRQTETAALKAVGKNKSKMFERKLCEVYTKATYLEDSMDETVGGWVICITENALNRDRQQPPQPNDAIRGIEKQVEIGLVAVRPESGEVVWDVFQDTAYRSELEKRLLMLDVLEVIVVGSLSNSSRKTFESADKRVEEVLRLDEHQAKSKITEFYDTRYSEQEAAPVLTKILNLPILVLECLHAQIVYLAEFQLASIFTLTNFFQNFETKMCLQLPATSISALEIFNNTTDNSEKGSLLWVIDSTRTLPGRRLLRRWLARPLTNLKEIGARQASIKEILDTRGTPFAQIDAARKMLRNLPDLDKGLSKIYYGKSSRPDVLKTLQAFSRVSRTFSPNEHFAFQSPALKDTFSSLTTVVSIIDSFLAEINHVETAKDDKYNMFKEVDTLDQISDQKMGILIVENDLMEHLAYVSKTLKRKEVSYSTVAGVEYLIELKNDALKLVPPDWLKMSGTKYVSRFHTPKITNLIAEREQRKELLAIECDKAYSDFLKRISTHYDTLRWIVSSIAELDCLLSLSAISSQPGYVQPTFLPASSNATINFVDSRHPIVEKLLTSTYISNTTKLSTDATRTIILTGPNMGGKSSFIKQVALCCILAHLGCHVPCTKATLTVLDGIYCRIGASDRILHRESTFMVELHEVSDIMSHATRNSLVILDELGRGTATYDGLAISHATLQHFITDLKSLVLFVTHYPSLFSLCQEYPKHVEAQYMSYLQSDVDGHQSITFLYKLVHGVATSSYGLNVARLAGLPESVILSASEMAREMEIESRTRDRLTFQASFEALQARNLSIDPVHNDLESVMALASQFL